MPYNKRKKNTRFRGRTNHGYGSKKKHRGSGHSGGVGMAGTGKRSDGKKPMVWDDPLYFGKHGFIMHGKTPKINAINIKYFEENADKLVAAKQIEHKEGYYVVDLKKLGYNKILGSGDVTKKYKITAQYSSSGATEKIKQAGGEVIVQNKQASHKQAEVKAEN